MRKVFFIVLLVSLCCVSCKLTPTRLVGKAQGTYYSIVYYDARHRNLQPQVDSLLAAFDLVASLWVDSSELCQFNRCADSMEVSECMADLFEKSMSISALTGGAFDCRVAPLVSAYGFARSNRRDLTQQDIDSLMVLCQAPVWLSKGSDGRKVLHKANAASRLDFNAIAQGYSVDLLCDMLQTYGIGSFIVDVGGEVRSAGAKPDGTPWSVGVERPAEDREDAREVDVAIPLVDCSIVTSGSYRKYYEKDGMRFSHTIDPATGRPVSHTTLSASVIDDKAWRADALATAFMVMGYERATAWLAAHSDIDKVYFIYDDNGENARRATPAFQRLIDDFDE
ncbi:MAG: FAD:protein FMN transferase [Bacteroidales bacterium]|nr:FAD:protein FMN transferase [Bacteroidales bacterium]